MTILCVASLLALIAAWISTMAHERTARQEQARRASIRIVENMGNFDTRLGETIWKGRCALCHGGANAIPNLSQALQRASESHQGLIDFVASVVDPAAESSTFTKSGLQLFMPRQLIGEQDIGSVVQYLLGNPGVAK